MSEKITQPLPAVGPPLVFALLEDERDLPLLDFAVPLGDVLALTVRPPDRASVLAHALGRHATRGVEVVDAAIADVDYLAVAHVLACAVRHLCSNAPVIVLAGDRGRAAIGPAVAERLAVPHLGAVLGIVPERDELLIERLSFTNRQRYRGRPPVVLQCVLPAAPADQGDPSETTDPTTTTVATSAGVELLALDDLQITMPELRYRRRFRPEPTPALRRRAALLPTIERLGDRLARDGVWPKAR